VTAIASMMMCPKGRTISTFNAVVPFIEYFWRIFY
jgi:hypothetical protein